MERHVQRVQLASRDAAPFREGGLSFELALNSLHGLLEERRLVCLAAVLAVLPVVVVSGRLVQGSSCAHSADLHRLVRVEWGNQRGR